jgi:hypothetical protein
MTNTVKTGGATALFRDVALAKWGHFADRHIRGNAHRIEEQMEALVRAGATEATLKVFWQETKHLSWPNTYGESPWETASGLACSLDARDRGAQVSPAGLARIAHFLEVERELFDASEQQEAAPARRLRP